MFLQTYNLTLFNILRKKAEGLDLILRGEWVINSFGLEESLRFDIKRRSIASVLENAA